MSNIQHIDSSPELDILDFYDVESHPTRNDKGSPRHGTNRCKSCQHTFTASKSRLELHISGSHQIKKCPNPPTDLLGQLKAKLTDTKSRKSQKLRSVKSYFSLAVQIENGVEIHRRTCSFPGCNRTFSTKTADNALKKHLQIDHSLFPADNKKQATLDGNPLDLVPSSLNVPLSEQQEQYLTTVIEDFIVLDQLPYSFAESTTLRALLSFVSPTIPQPCRNTVKNRILKRYTRGRDQIMSLLKHPNAVNITLDLWSSRQRVPYLGITCHFVEEFKFHSIVLSVDIFPHPHNGEQVNQMVTKILHEIGIGNKVLSITTDNAANLAKASTASKFESMYTSTTPTSAACYTASTSRRLLFS
ncbi:hypothetical protein P9112_005210 [Eukaryota sp. TZLM1-RC]